MRPPHQRSASCPSRRAVSAIRASSSFSSLAR
jgi:hypothetical protein